MAFKLPHRRIRCGGKLPLPVFAFTRGKAEKKIFEGEEMEKPFVFAF